MADESLIVLGTPLPQIKKTDAFGDPKKPNPTRDQEVRDEQGRRRFHGAFTGGFSAGYFNTVGSKEGWTPSEFVSSRNKRMEQKVLRPEDFMDEEDKQLAADSSKLVAKEDFDTLGSTQRELERKRAAARNMQETGGVLGALPDYIIDDLVVPSSESVGIRLLKRMGWKPGQGIGPRVTKRVRKQQQVAEDEDILDVDLPADMTFAPIDSAIVVFTNKANHFGLGYDPYKDAPEFDRSLRENSDSKYLSGSTGGERKIGFGLGSLDDDDEDDDIYGSGPGPTLSLSSIEQHDMPSSRSSRSGKQHRTESRSDPKRPKEEDLVPRYCHDGRPPLRGFTLAGKDSQTGVKWFDPPKVPKDFVPRHVFRQEELERRPYPGVHVGPPRRGDQQQPKLTADDRSLILGETPIEGPKRSVFEYMSAENKNRLDNILGFVMDTEGEKHMRKDRWEIPKLEPAAALAALQGFIPFGDNLAKQNRYKLYLNVQAGLVPEGDKAIEKVEGFTGEDMNKELNEFVQAARIFKPLTASMANRFTSASKTIEFAQPAASGLRTAAEVQQAGKDSPRPGAVERMEVPKSQAAKAAAMGMFGPLTRSTVDFYPVKLLCKRFHVADPHPDHKDQSKGDNVKDLLDKRTMESMMINRRQGEGMDEAAEKTAAADAAKKEAEELEEKERKKQEEEEQKRAQEAQVVPERPPMDIFKAIFDDSDSDSDDDEDEDNKPSVVPKPDEVPKTTDPDTAVDADNDDQTDSLGKPFRPMFSIPTKSERSMASKSGSSRASRAVKLDLDNDGEGEEDEEVMGPRLSIPKPKTVGTKRSVSRRKEEEDEAEEREQRDFQNAEPVKDDDDDDDDDVMVGPMPPPPRAEGEEYDSDTRNKRHKSSKETESSPPVESRRGGRGDSLSGSESEDDEPSRSRSHQRSSGGGGSMHGTKRSYRSRTRSKSPVLSSTEKEEKESRSHSRSESHGRSHRESSRKKSKKDDKDRDSERDRDRDHARENKDRDRDRERNRDRGSKSGKSRSSSEKHRSSSSRLDRHHESRDKDRRDRDRDRDRSSRHSDKDRGKDKKSSRRDRDREGDYPKEVEEDEDLWVEKLPRTASKPPSSNRPRASAFF